MRIIQDTMSAENVVCEDNARFSDLVDASLRRSYFLLRRDFVENDCRFAAIKQQFGDIFNPQCSRCGQRCVASVAELFAHECTLDNLWMQERIQEFKARAHWRRQWALQERPQRWMWDAGKDCNKACAVCGSSACGDCRLTLLRCGICRARFCSLPCAKFHASTVSSSTCEIVARAEDAIEDWDTQHLFLKHVKTSADASKTICVSAPADFTAPAESTAISTHAECTNPHTFVSKKRRQLSASSDVSVCEPLDQPAVLDTWRCMQSQSQHPPHGSSVLNFMQNDASSVSKGVLNNEAEFGVHLFQAAARADICVTTAATATFTSMVTVEQAEGVDLQTHDPQPQAYVESQAHKDIQPQKQAEPHHEPQAQEKTSFAKRFDTPDKLCAPSKQQSGPQKRRRYSLRPQSYLLKHQTKRLFEDDADETEDVDETSLAQDAKDAEIDDKTAAKEPCATLVRPDNQSDVKTVSRFKATSAQAKKNKQEALAYSVPVFFVREMQAQKLYSNQITYGRFVKSSRLDVVLHLLASSKSSMRVKYVLWQEVMQLAADRPWWRQPMVSQTRDLTKLRLFCKSRLQAITQAFELCKDVM